jgi:hypothetical protein
MGFSIPNLRELFKQVAGTKQNRQLLQACPQCFDESGLFTPRKRIGKTQEKGEKNDGVV